MSKQNVKLKVDHREQKLKPYFEKHNNVVEYENLTYGDFQILVDDKIEFILERKTIDDLLASVKDGRYNNQKARLFEQFKASQIFYIIEGVVPYQGQTTLDKIATSSIINTSLRDKIGIFNTKSLADTHALVCGIFDRVQKDPQKYLHPAETQEQTVIETSSTDDSSKIFAGMLCQIPGVSNKSVQSLVQRWPTFQVMHTELHPLSNEERVNVLNSIKVASRKISKRIVDGILKVFF